MSALEMVAAGGFSAVALLTLWAWARALAVMIEDLDLQESMKCKYDPFGRALRQYANGSEGADSYPPWVRERLAESAQRYEIAWVLAFVASLATLGMYIWVVTIITP
jgi:hypothetical protein